MLPEDISDEARRLRFEGRKFALETLIRFHMVQVETGRNLRVGHVKLTFALSLGALAGFLTLIGAFARFVESFPVWPADRTGIMLLLAGLGCLMVGALVAILQYRTTIDRSADLLHRPYLGAEAAFQDLIGDPTLDETAALDRLSAILRNRMEDPRHHHPPSSYVLLLILAGACMTALSLLML